MQANKVLHNLLEKTCIKMHSKRRASLEANVLGSLIGQRLTVTDIGRSIQSDTSPKHNIKRADRLISNKHLHQELFSIYRSLCHQLIGNRKQPVILIDWSDMDKSKRHFLLRASIALEGRSLTLYEEVHTLETKETPATHKAFLCRLHEMVPSHSQPILITDAGFRTTWFQLVEDLGWNWVSRVRNRNYMRWLSGGRWFASNRCYQQANTRPKHLGRGLLTQRNQHECEFVIFKSKAKGRKHYNHFGEIAQNHYSRKKAAGEREPWLLASSLPVTHSFAKRLVKLYSTRMQIEESFRDMKSERFGLGLNYQRTRTKERLAVLLLIAHLAVIVLWIIGQATILRKQHYQFQANSIKHKRVLSIVFIGLQVVNACYQVKLKSEDIAAAWRLLHEV